MATAAVAVAALWFTGQSLHAAQNQYGLSEQGQVTDRFGKAIEHLGSDKIDVRLGGICALERLARDSPADHPTVFEVLGAFIRTHAPVGPTCPPLNVPGAGAIAEDIQAAVTVIGRRDTSHDGSDTIDLSNSCLVEASMIDAKLAHADLFGANLTDAFLLGADLTDTDLTDTVLNGAVLDGAVLDGVHYDEHTEWPGGFTPPPSR
ncbi:pentapeptide repeat-containing protein [Nocardia sp. NPDC051911]|uniref:pentapeptide repeat-containing protein n=1 Tax=Nocardia sp. NPDC051911 TaxID=3154648 RepID=UPI00342F908E